MPTAVAAVADDAAAVVVVVDDGFVVRMNFGHCDKHYVMV